MHNPKVAAVQRQSAIQRILKEEPAAPGEPPPGAGGEKHEEEQPLDRQSYRILRGRIERLETLELRNRRHQKRQFDWDGVTGANLDDPGRLVLHVLRGGEPYTVTIVGRGLDRELADGVRTKRVEWIAELDELGVAAALKADPNTPVVTGVRIEKGSMSSEW
jgi:hypothetical protein